MLVSIVVPEKLPLQKRCDEEAEEEEHEFLGVFDVFFFLQNSAVIAILKTSAGSIDLF